MLRRPQGLRSLSAPGKSSTDLPSTPSLGPPSGAASCPPETGRAAVQPLKWGWRSCACAAGCWWGLSIGLGPEGRHYGQGSFAWDSREEGPRIWPERPPEGSLGKRGAELKLVSAQHSVMGMGTRHAATGLHCASRGTPAAWLQPCQAHREGRCAQPHWSTSVQKG